MARCCRVSFTQSTRVEAPLQDPNASRDASTPPLPPCKVRDPSFAELSWRWSLSIDTAALPSWQMASHRKSAPTLPPPGQVLPPPPARLTPQIRRLDCTWWRCKSTHREASSWRPVAGEFLGGWKRVCGGGTRFREQPRAIATNRKVPSAFCPSRAGPRRYCPKASSDPHTPRTQALGKAAGDPLRSPPAAAPVETNCCLLTNHLPQMWQERSPGCFSHKFLPSSLSGFPRRAGAIIALQTTPYYAEQNCFSAWGRLRNTPKGEDCRIPQNRCTGPVILKNQRAFHWAIAVLGSEISTLRFFHATYLNATWFCAPSSHCWALKRLLLLVASSFSSRPSARPHKGQVCQVMHKESEWGASQEHVFASRIWRNKACFFPKWPRLLSLHRCRRSTICAALGVDPFY